MRPQEPVRYLRALKSHVCTECKKPIGKGDLYHRVDGPVVGKYHKHCWEKRVHRPARWEEFVSMLRKRGPVFSDEIPAQVRGAFIDARKHGIEVQRFTWNRGRGKGRDKKKVTFTIYYLHDHRYWAMKRIKEKGYGEYCTEIGRAILHQDFSTDHGKVNYDGASD